MLNALKFQTIFSQAIRGLNSRRYSTSPIIRQRPSLPSHQQVTFERLSSCPGTSKSATTSNSIATYQPQYPFSLSRRFTLLRNSNGEPLSLNDMRSKFAEQRARGAENQISEEEEDMIVQALGEIQAANITGSQSSFPPTPNNTAAAFSPGTDGTFARQQNIPAQDPTGGELDYPTSVRSGTASIASSPSSVYPRSNPSSTSASRTSTSSRYTSKRNSNNLFGSGRFHDTSYLHSVSKASMGSSRSTTSLIGSDSHGGSVRSTHSTRETEADSGQALASDADLSGDSVAIPGKVSSSRAWPASPYSPFSALPPRLSKEFTLQQARRTSLALEQVIRGLEEEAEETIMVPRTSSSKAGALNARTQVGSYLFHGR
jgi:serine/arginine repetitive matrix protein 2